jgi:membrane dipeptidase
VRRGLVAPLGLLLLAHGASADPASERLHRDAIVIDGHNDVPSLILDYGFDLGMDGTGPEKKSSLWSYLFPWLFAKPRGDELRTDTDLRRLGQGGVDAQFFSIFPHARYAKTPGASRDRANAMIDALLEQIRRHADRLELATSADDVRRIAASGKIAALMGLEGGHAIENDLDNLRAFHARGVRYMTLTWSNTNDWADSSGDAPRHGGLTDFGREVVREMNRIGMLVDVSHVSDDTFWDAIETSTRPLIASHSSARALCDVPRNMTDDMLRAVAKNGGVVMVNFGGPFIDPRKTGFWNFLWDTILHFGPSPVPLSLLLDQLEHVAQVAGIDHVGLGSDFDGAPFMPEGVSDVAGYPAITAGLAARGHSDDEIRKILGGNTLRVLAEAGDETATTRGSPAHGPSEATP